MLICLLECRTLFMGNHGGINFPPRTERGGGGGGGGGVGIQKMRQPGNHVMYIME